MTAGTVVLHRLYPGLRPCAGYDRRHSDAALRELKSQGLSIRKLYRLTEINLGVIRKA